RRASGLPRSAYGGMLAHAGVGLTVIGIVATSAWRAEHVVVLRQGERSEIAGYDLSFRGVAPRQGPNYQEVVGFFTVTRNGKPDGELTPSKRTFDTPQQTTTEAGIQVSWRGDLYVVLGDEQPGGGWVVRLYFNPLVRLIWLGAVLMALGGLLSLSDRRLRIGVPRRSRRPIAAPAEEGMRQRPTQPTAVPPPALTAACEGGHATATCSPGLASAGAGSQDLHQGAAAGRVLCRRRRSPVRLAQPLRLPSKGSSQRQAWRQCRAALLALLLLAVA